MSFRPPAFFFSSEAAWKCILRWNWYVIPGRAVAHAMITPTDDEFRLRSTCGQSASYAADELETCTESDLRFKANAGLSSYICEQCLAEIAGAGVRHQVHADPGCSIRRAALRALRAGLKGESEWPNTSSRRCRSMRSRDSKT